MFLTRNDAMMMMQAITERQAREIEFYFRACALRLEQGAP